MFDYVQNSQMNSSQSDWNSLHKAVSNINQLTRVVAETNNEVHYAKEQAVSALNEAKWSLDNVNALTTNYETNAAKLLAEVSSHVSIASSHSDNADNHADRAEEHLNDVRSFHSSVQSVVESAKNDIKAHVHTELADLTLNVNKAEGHAENSKNYSLSASAYEQKAKGHADEIKTLVNDWTPDSSVASKVELSSLQTKLESVDDDLLNKLTAVELELDSIDLSDLATVNSLNYTNTLVLNNKSAIEDRPTYDEVEQTFNSALVNLATKEDTSKLQDQIDSINSTGLGVTNSQMTAYVESYVNPLNERVKLLEGGGVGEALEARISTLESDLTEESAKVATLQKDISTLKSELAKAIERIIALETAEPEIPVNPNPSKFYVLPLSGQSNMVGYGEVPSAANYLSDIDSRIKQIHRTNTWDAGTLNSTNTGYGERFNELRTPDSRGLIPATPNLDHNQNMFIHNVGGTLGAGLYIAKEILKHIPNDYGIIIVPCAYGGKAFKQGYFGANTAHAIDMRDRIKQAMDISPENKLLPFVWTQGESDGMSGGNLNHMAAFKSFYDWMKTELNAYVSRTVCGYKWFCCGPTKWAMKANTETDYINHEMDIGADSSRVRDQVAVYDHYSYLGSEYPNEIFSVRIDVQNDGNYTETNRENGNGATTSTREIHFSSEGYKNTIAPNVANAILTYGFGKEPKMHTRKIHGGCGYVETDNVVYNYKSKLPTLGASVSNPSSLESFAIKFDYHVSEGLRAEQSTVLNSGNGINFRYQGGVLSVSIGSVHLFLSAFYQGSWIGGYGDTQEVVFIYKKETQEALLYLNGDLVDSNKGITGITLPSSVTITSPAVVQESFSNLSVHSL